MPQFQIGKSPYKIVAEGDPPGVIINRDLTDVVNWGATQEDCTSDPSSLDPYASFPVDGSTDIWVVCNSANGALVDYVHGAGSFFRGITQGQGKLVIPSIQSPNYVPGSVGWSINNDGSAEFNNITIRGNFVGPNFFFSNGDGSLSTTPGYFLYSGTPAAGNLVYSSTASITGTGHDKFSNNYLAGDTSYDNSLTQAVNRASGVITFYTFNSQPNATFIASAGIQLSQDITTPGLEDVGIAVNEYLQINRAGNLTNLSNTNSGCLTEVTENDPTTVYNVGGSQFIRLGSNVRITTTPFTPVFTFANVQPSASYRVTALLKIFANNSVGNAVIAWAHGPTATVLNWVSRAWFVGGTGPTAVQNAQSAAFPVDATTGTLVSGATTGYELEGTFQVSAAGSVVLSAAETGGGDFYILGYSSVEIRRMN